MVASRASACGKGALEQNVSIIHGTSLTGGMQSVSHEHVHPGSYKARNASSDAVVPDQSIQNYLRQQLFLPDQPTPYLFKPLDTRQPRLKQASRVSAAGDRYPAKPVQDDGPPAAYDRVRTIDGRVLGCEGEKGSSTFKEELLHDSIDEITLAPFSVPYGELYTN